MEGNFITREEHEEFRRGVNAENERQNHRIAALEETMKNISALSTSVEKLAVNMENMLKEQKTQGERLKTLEGRDGENWRKVVGYVFTAIAGIVIGFVFKQIGMG